MSRKQDWKRRKKMSELGTTEVRTPKTKPKAAKRELRNDEDARKRADILKNKRALREKRINKEGLHLFIPPELKEKGYEYYWEVNKPAQVNLRLSMQWDIVKDKEGKNVTTLPKHSRDDSMILMRIEEELYQEDYQKDQKRCILESNEKMQKLGDGEYVPDGHDHVVEADRQLAPLI